MPSARRERAGCRAEARAGVEQPVALAKIVSGRPDVGALRAGSSIRTPPSATFVVFSWITTASAPVGTGAPVKMRTAPPGGSAPSKAWPAADSPTI